MRRERLEAGGARAVADQRAAGDGGGRGGDLAVRHAQQHGGGAAGVRAAPERAEYGETGRTQSGGEGGAEAARADDGDRVQFPHGDTGFRLLWRA